MNQKPRVLLFKIISAGLAVVLLLLLELLLRLFHYGQDHRLFISYPADNNYLVLNPAASRKYFLNQQIATTGNSEIFRKEKGANTCRIFVLGESTTIGYPYFHNGAFHRWLQYRLMHTFPDKDFEVINLSLTAVNSFTVLGFARELAPYRPDAVLIYSGHNEFYGSLGVGSTERINGNPRLVNMVIALRELRLVQLVTACYKKLPGLAKGPSEDKGKARMERMVASQQIPFGSKLYNRGVEQFRANMEATLRFFDQKKIPVFISNLVSNEKDLPPFISIAPDSSRYPGFQRAYTRALAALKAQDTAAALAAFNAADRSFNGHAACNYYMGRLLLSLGDTMQARNRFAAAKDLDALRFRAPSELNALIPQLCRKYRHAHLVDAKAAFEGRSAQHIIGNELMLEHIHPRLEGYAVLSDAFYRAMERAGILPTYRKQEMSLAQLERSMPLTAVDSLAGAYKIYNLKRSWPFNTMAVEDTLKVSAEEERLAYGLAFEHSAWPQVMDTLYNYYVSREEWAKACRVTEGLLLEYPLAASLYEKTANLYGKMNDYERAAFYFRKAFALSPAFETARTLFVLYLKMDRPVAAMPYLDYAMQHNVPGMNLAPVRQLTAEIIQLQRNAGKTGLSPAVLNPVVDRYIKMGNSDGAATYLEKVLRSDPANKTALLLLTRLKKV
jgi:tetratricopeptide (TPR) repeat protein